MKKRTAALFVFNGYADWGPALALGLLRSQGDFAIRTFSIDGEPVLSMGGLVVQPSCYLDQLTAEKTNLLILPGGDAWQEGQNRELLPLVEEMLWQNKPVASICGATLLPAAAGLLDNIPHTSNNLAYLCQHCPEYNGEQHYQYQPCVTGDNLITAHGSAMIEFAVAIAAATGCMTEEKIWQWMESYKSPHAHTFTGYYQLTCE